MRWDILRTARKACVALGKRLPTKAKLLDVTRPTYFTVRENSMSFVVLRNVSAVSQSFLLCSLEVTYAKVAVGMRSCRSEFFFLGIFHPILVLIPDLQIDVQEGRWVYPH